MYEREGLTNLPKKSTEIKSTEINTLICFILNNIIFVMAYISPKVSKT